MVELLLDFFLPLLEELTLSLKLTLIRKLFLILIGKPIKHVFPFLSFSCYFHFIVVVFETKKTFTAWEEIQLE